MKFLLRLIQFCGLGCLVLVAAVQFGGLAGLFWVVGLGALAVVVVTFVGGVAFEVNHVKAAARLAKND